MRLGGRIRCTRKKSFVPMHADAGAHAWGIYAIKKYTPIPGLHKTALHVRVHMNVLYTHGCIQWPLTHLSLVSPCSALTGAWSVSFRDRPSKGDLRQLLMLALATEDRFAGSFTDDGGEVKGL